MTNRVNKCLIIFLLSLYMGGPRISNAEGTPASPLIDAPAASLLQRSFAALSAGGRLDDVELQGTAFWHAGSDELQGSATLKANSSGRSRVQLDLGSQRRTEFHSGHNEKPACTWAGSDNVPNKAAVHNCWTIGPWFFPVLSILPAQQQGKTIVTYIGREMRGDLAVEHLSIQRVITDTSPKARALDALMGATDLYLDAGTMLPSSFTYFDHPDNDARRKVQIVVQFSDYRDTGGGKAPFRIQKSMNGSVILELSISSATFNSGVLNNEGPGQR